MKKKKQVIILSTSKYSYDFPLENFILSHTIDEQLLVTKLQFKIVRHILAIRREEKI